MTTERQNILAILDLLLRFLFATSKTDLNFN